MAAATARRAGRPTTAPKEGEKATLGIRASADLKRRLNEAASQGARGSGRSLSAEAEFRLERSFAEEDALGGAAMKRAGFSMIAALGHAGAQQARSLGRSPDPAQWLADPECYRAAMVAVLNALADDFPGGFTPADLDYLKERVRSHMASRENNREPFVEQRHDQ